jgi:hypothetical protein
MPEIDVKPAIELTGKNGRGIVKVHRAQDLAFSNFQAARKIGANRTVLTGPSWRGTE